MLFNAGKGSGAVGEHFRVDRRGHARRAQRTARDRLHHEEILHVAILAYVYLRVSE